MIRHAIISQKIIEIRIKIFALNVTATESKRFKLKIIKNTYNLMLKFPWNSQKFEFCGVVFESNVTYVGILKKNLHARDFFLDLKWLGRDEKHFWHKE